MRLTPCAVALLIAPLAACGGSSEQTTPSAAETATDVATASEPAAPAPAADATVETRADDSTCGADKLGRWLNVLPSEDMKAEIAAAVGERPIRYYTQGDPITMDFSAARLNVELGTDGRIKLFRCG